MLPIPWNHHYSSTFKILVFQIPIVNIIVLNKKKADKESDPCQLMFADPEDCGKISLEDIHIYTVFNGIDHIFWVLRTESLHSGMGLMKSLINLWRQHQLVSSLLMIKTVQLTLSQAVNVIKSVGHNLNKMFIPMEDEDDVKIPATKKKRTSKEPEENKDQKSYPSLHFTVPVENYSAMMMSWCIIKNRRSTGTVKSVM